MIDERGAPLPNDPRIGRRVLYLHADQIDMLYGTVHAVMQFSSGDSLEVHCGPGLRVLGDEREFAYLEPQSPEWVPGDRVRHETPRGISYSGTVVSLDVHKQDGVVAVVAFDPAPANPVLKLAIPVMRLKSELGEEQKGKRKGKSPRT